MKTLFLILFTSLLCANLSFSQNSNEIVLLKKRYYQNEKKLTNNDLKSILLSNSESAAEYKIAKKNSTIAAVPMVAGTALCLLGSFSMLKSSIDETNAINNGDIYYEASTAYVAPVLLGAGLVLAGVPFALASNKHLKKSISIYNSNQATGYRDIQKLEFGLTQNGVGITYRF